MSFYTIVGYYSTLSLEEPTDELSIFSKYHQVLSIQFLPLLLYTWDAETVRAHRLKICNLFIIMKGRLRTASQVVTYRITDSNSKNYFSISNLLCLSFLIADAKPASCIGVVHDDFPFKGPEASHSQAPHQFYWMTTQFGALYVCAHNLHF